AGAAGQGPQQPHRRGTAADQRRPECPRRGCHRHGRLRRGHPPPEHQPRLQIGGPPVPEPLNWKTRLEISVDGKPVTPIESFTPTFNTQTTPIHSIEGDNVGAVFHPQTATFTMTLKAIGTSVAELTKLAISGTKFSISLAEKKGTDWTFKKMLFRDC